MRIGSGVDVHAFSDDAQRALVLGGVQIAGAPGLVGHSDADVVAHALCDALLGAAAIGDLGSRFGTDEPELAGADSMMLLWRVRSEINDAGFTVGNVDLTIIAQRPRLAAYRDGVRDRLASALGVEPEAVSVKITSTDGLGALGRGEGIACWATCLLV